MENKSFVSSKRSEKLALKSLETVMETYIVIPPDGGWGWVVVVVSFLFNFVADGIMYTFGLFLIDISKSFEATETKVSLANSLMSGFYYLLGPLASGLTNRFGYRVIAILGGSIATAAIFISSFMYSLPVFLFIYGFVGGLGFCMTYVTSIIVVGFYFERWRALATSIAVCGSSSGIIVFPPVMKMVMGSLTWRVKFKILAAFCLGVTFLGILYRPLKPRRVISGMDPSRSTENSGSGAAEKPGLFKKLFGRFHNTKYPTTADLHKGSLVTLAGLADLSESTDSVMSAPTRSLASFKSLRTTKLSKLSAWTGDRMDTLYEEEELPNNCCKRCLIKTKYAFTHCCEKGDVPKARPMYKDDIFFGGSIATLPGYAKSSTGTAVTAATAATGMDYTMSVTRTATAKDYLEDHKCVCCPESVRRTLSTMLDMSLLKSPSFLLLSVSGFFTVLGMYTPFMYIEQRAIKHGIEKSAAVLLITLLGVTNTIGRIFSGIISSLPNMNANAISYVSLIMSGAVTILSCFWITTAVQYTYACVYGLTVACFASLRPIVVVELLGIEKLTNAFGISMTFQGIACFCGVPIAGALLDYTGDYNVCFYFSGGTIIFSGIMLIPLMVVAKWEAKKEQQP